MTNRIIRQINELTLDQINDRLRNIELNRQIQADLNRYGMYYKGDYDPDTCYKAGDVVLVNDNYLARAKRDTCDSALITFDGEPFWFSGLGDPPPPFSGAGNTFTAKLRGNQYNMPTYGQSVYVSKLRWVSPSVITNTAFRLYHSIWRERTQDWVSDGILGEILVSNPNTWRELPYSALWLNTEYHRLWTQIISKQTPTTFNANWTQVHGNITPSSGEVAFYNNQTRMRFHHTDSDSNNRQAALEAVPPGATITRGSDEWTVTATTHNANDVDFNVSPGGQRGPAATYNWQFSYGTAGYIWHASLNRTGEWPFDVQIVQGMRVNYPGAPDVAYNENQFMLDPYVQAVTISEDWDIMTVPNT